MESLGKAEGTSFTPIAMLYMPYSTFPHPLPEMLIIVTLSVLSLCLHHRGGTLSTSFPPGNSAPMWTQGRGGGRNWFLSRSTPNDPPRKTCLQE